MPIRQLTPWSDIDRFTEQELQRLHKAVIRTFQYCGEMALNAARSTNSYKDQTGNLRSSLGYVVAVDGKVVYQSDFETVKNGNDGSVKGAKYAKELVRRFPKGVCLIVVAGMEYAAYVKNRGYDVLDSSELLADKIVPRMLKQLGFK